MGREIAEAVPEAMEVFERGERRLGPRPQRALLRGAARGARRDGGAAAGARRDEPRRARRAARARDRARLRRRPLGRRVRRARGRRRARHRGGDRARARARARDGRGGAPAARARWPRSSGSRTRSSRSSAADPRRVAGELQLPGPARRLRRARRPSTSAATRPRTRGAKRAVKLKVSGAFHCPLVARAAERLSRRSTASSSRAAAPFMSTVTAKIEPAQRVGTLLVDQLTAPVRFTQAARELIKEGVGTFVEVGPGNVLSGLVKRIDKSVKADLRQQPRRASRSSTKRSTPREPDSARSRARPLSSPAARGASGRRSRSSSREAGATVVVGYRSAAEEAEAVAAETGGRAIQADVSDPDEARRLVEEAGDVDMLVNNAGITRDGLLAAHARRRLARRARHEPQRRLPHVPRRLARDDAPPLGLDREPLQRRRRARQPGPDELRGLEGRDHRLHEVARARARRAAACARTSSRRATSTRG